MSVLMSVKDSLPTHTVSLYTCVRTDSCESESVKDSLPTHTVSLYTCVRTDSCESETRGLLVWADVHVLHCRVGRSCCEAPSKPNATSQALDSQPLSLNPNGLFGYRCPQGLSGVSGIFRAEHMCALPVRSHA